MINSQIGVTPAQLAAGGKDMAGFINSAVGAGLINSFRSNVQHPFDRVFFRNTADLAGQKLTFFQTPISGSYTVLNSTTSVTKTAEDTNWDQANQAQYSYLLTGMYLKVQTLEYQSFQASPNDLSTWSDTLRALLEDSSVQIVMEDNIMMRQKAIHIPEGNAVTGVTGVTGTAAAPQTQGSQPNVSNGFAAASNIFGFGNMALWVPKGSRFNTFGASALTASMAYKPAANRIFAEIRYQGIKFQMPS